MTRVLVVDDDPVGRRFLADALATLGFEPVACADAAGALAAARAPSALFVVDLRLPDASGAQCLARLRTLQPDVPALALSADLDAAGAAAALASGFDAALAKPLSVAALGRAVAALTGAVLDDEAGARSAGGADNLAVLRGLLARELPDQLDAIAAALARDDREALGDVVHRLRGAATFCGALPLAEALQRLAATPGDAALARLRRVASATLSGLIRQRRASPAHSQR